MAAHPPVMPPPSQNLARFVMKKIHPLVVAAVLLWGGTFVMPLPEEIRFLPNILVRVALLIQCALLLTALMDFFMLRQQTETEASKRSWRHVRLFGRSVVWVLVGAAILDNIGVSITALGAGFGIGGIAIGFALRHVLGDFFASISIVLDKPFEVNDFIAVGEFLGHVEKVGIKTTRIRSLTGEQLIFSNEDLLQSRIRNLKRMQERRAVFSFDLTLQSAQEAVQSLPLKIKQIIEAQERTRFDRAHFKEIQPHALRMEVVFFVLAPESKVYLDIQQSINFEILRLLRKEKLSFAYPSLLTAPLPCSASTQAVSSMCS